CASPVAQRAGRAAAQRRRDVRRDDRIRSQPRLRRKRLRPGELRRAESGNPRHSGHLPRDLPPHNRGTRRSVAAGRLILRLRPRSRKMTGTAEGGDDMTIEVGDTAPDFTLPADGGGTASLKALRGKKVILY